MQPVSKKGKEADVEARILLPLLTTNEYLGIPHVYVRNKAYLTPQKIDKAAGRTTGYYPDFSVWCDALPIVIVEAKAPDVSVEVGYREAGQYALHLNRQYKSVDPCGYIVSCNGQRFQAGMWNEPPEIDCQVERLVVGGPELELLRSRIAYPVVQQQARLLRQSLSASDTYQATRGPSTTSLLATRVPPNQFASALIPTLARYFSSPTDDLDPAVYDTAYVPTDEQLAYDASLENLLRDKAQKRRNPFLKDLQSTKYEVKDFSSRIFEYAGEQRNTSQILLVIGHVGAGKSLFIRRYRNLLVPESLVATTLWSFINFNDAPPVITSATEWLSRSFVESFEQEQPAIDIYSDEHVSGMLGPSLQRNRAVYDRLERLDPVAAELERAGDVRRWLEDWGLLSRSLTRYYCGEQGYTCVAVFDNVDRLDKDDQLAVFQLALGFTTEHRTLTVLQMRDETFERYKDHKPLDTFKTGVSFHITPPRFASVVKKRLEIAIEDLRQNARKEWEYELENGARVRISRDQALGFLQDVYGHVFGEGLNASRVLQGLAGRNVRRALDIFFRVIISGHIASDRITSVAMGARAFPITDELLLRAIMRGDYRFFHDGSGFTSNIFWYEQGWLGADNLLLPEILFFLASNVRTKGSIGLEGYFSTEKLAERLQLLGYPLETVSSAAQWLLSKGLVEADNMATHVLDQQTAVRISSSGFIHLRILSERLEYLSACLYVTPFVSKEMADFAGGMFSDSFSTGMLSPARKAQGVQHFRKYIRELAIHRAERAPNLVGLETCSDYILTHIEAAISEGIRSTPRPSGPDALDL